MSLPGPLVIFAILVAAVALFVIAIFGAGSAPRDEGAHRFLAKCAEVGFTPAQCEFFQHGAGDDPRSNDILP